MTQVAEEAGMSRESPYKALSAEGNPSFATVATKPQLIFAQQTI